LETEVERKHYGGIEMKVKKNVAQMAVALVLCLTMVMVGCSTSWIEEAEQIVAALIPAAANLVTLVAALQGKTVSAADLQTIQNAGTQAGADLQLIQSLVAAYEKADAASKPGILNQIETAINATQASLQGLLPALHIKDAATQAKITAVVGVVLSEVQSLAAIVPLVKADAELSVPAASSVAKMRQRQTLLSASEFVASYNATLSAKTGNTDVDKMTAGLKIHSHGKAARWATAGMLK
jgi:hypothetical protein